MLMDPLFNFLFLYSQAAIVWYVPKFNQYLLYFRRDNVGLFCYCFHEVVCIIVQTATELQ